MTFDRLEQLAFGVLGMTDDEFWDTTWRSFNNRLAGFYELIEHREQMDWERVRWQSALILNMFVKKGKTLKPTDLIRFPWDSKVKKEKPKIDVKEMRERFAKMDALAMKEFQQLKNGTKKGT